LNNEGAHVHRVYVGEFATSMEMIGVSLTIFRLADNELIELLDYPVKTPFFTQLDERK